MDSNTSTKCMFARTCVHVLLAANNLKHEHLVTTRIAETVLTSRKLACSTFAQCCQTQISNINLHQLHQITGDCLKTIIITTFLFSLAFRYWYIYEGCLISSILPFFIGTFTRGVQYLQFSLCLLVHL